MIKTTTCLLLAATFVVTAFFLSIARERGVSPAVIFFGAMAHYVSFAVVATMVVAGNRNNNSHKKG